MTNTYENAIRSASEEMTARSRAADDLLNAFGRARANLEPSGWALTQNPAPSADHFLVGFTMRRDGRDVAQCVFKVGPGRLVQFEGPGARSFAGSVDDLGEADYHRLIEKWAGSVQAAHPRSPMHPALKAEDGAKFYGRVDDIGGGLWRAACHAMLDQGGSTFVEQPDSQVFADKAGGRAWIIDLARRRGFAKWYDETADER